jgi:hypothetical protein
MKKLILILLTTLITAILFIEFNSTKDAYLTEGSRENTLDLYQSYDGKIDLEYLKEITN